MTLNRFILGTCGWLGYTSLKCWCCTRLPDWLPVQVPGSENTIRYETTRWELACVQKPGWGITSRGHMSVFPRPDDWCHWDALRPLPHYTQFSVYVQLQQATAQNQYLCLHRASATFFRWFDDFYIFLVKRTRSHNVYTIGDHLYAKSSSVMCSACVLLCIMNRTGKCSVATIRLTSFRSTTAYTCLAQLV